MLIPLNPLSNNLFLTDLQRKVFQNIMGKRENADDYHFLRRQQMSSFRILLYVQPFTGLGTVDNYEWCCGSGRGALMHLRYRRVPSK